MRDVEAHRPLPAVGRLEERVETPVHVVQARGHQAPVRVAGLGVLDLDHIGAPLREHRSRHGDEHVGGHLDDPDVA